MARWDEKREFKKLTEAGEDWLETDEEWSMAVWGSVGLGEPRFRTLDGPLRPKKLEAIWARLRELCLARSTSGGGYRLDDNAQQDALDSAGPRRNPIGSRGRDGGDDSGGSTLH